MAQLFSTDSYFIYITISYLLTASFILFSAWASWNKARKIKKREKEL